jgi:hypothetical protein
MTYFALVDNKVRALIVFANSQNELQLFESDRGCYCCASDCSTEVTIQVTFCGMTVTITLPIPGVNGFTEATIKPDPDSYLIVEASIACTDCGWSLAIGVCGYCDATNQFASDSFTALIPFFSAEETPGAGYCPVTGEVDLICFGEQFGIPCVSTATASIA